MSAIVPTSSDVELPEGNPILSAEEAAAYLRLAPQTLANWRSAWRKRGVPTLPFIQIGRRITYRLEDLQEFQAKRHYGGVKLVA